MGAPIVVTLPEELDIYTEPAVRRALEPVNGPCVVDMSRVRYIDASAIGHLARLAKRIGPGAGVLIVPSPHVRKVLGIVRLNELFRIVERVDQAAPQAG